MTTFPLHADELMHGCVRVPIVLTSRAGKTPLCLASCAVALLPAWRTANEK